MNESVTACSADTGVLRKGCINHGMVEEWINSLLTAKVSTNEEPYEGKLHAVICAGDVDQSAFLS